MAAGDPRWESVLGRLGGPLPLILVDHGDNAAAEATLFASPHWRCVYFDAVAAVFVPRDGRGTLEQAYPTVDFVARHFQRPPWPAQRFDPESAHHETLALEQIASFLAHRPVSPWALQIPMSLVAMDQAREVAARSPHAAAPWLALGHAAIALAPARHSAGAGTGLAWDPAVDLLWAQASAAYRAAVERDPGDESSRRILAASFVLR
jgi:hypothetical protein